MTFRQAMLPDSRARLDEIASIFFECRNAFHETVATYGWTPVEGSVAADDAAALLSPDIAVSEPQGETEHRLIAEAVQIFLLSASGHMGGLAGLYRTGEVLFSPPLIIRAVIENCAHALWVLGDDSSEAAENRLARAYLEELLSAEEAKKNAGRLRSKTDTTYLRTEREYKKLKAQVLVRFPDATKAELGVFTLHGQKLPGLEAIVKWMYALTEAKGGTISQDAASGIYGLFSNLTHPTLYPIREKSKRHDERATTNATLQLHIDVDALERDARAALAAFYNALNYVNSYFGWPTVILDALEVRLGETIPDFFR